MKSIAIIDFKNQDMGLKILFPEADYFILEEEFDRTAINTKYNIQPIIHNKTCNIYEEINDTKYDTLLIICPIYSAVSIYNEKENTFCDTKTNSYQNTANKIKEVFQLINQNNFSRVCIFDNWDYDYDPNIVSIINPEYNIIIESKNITFFKRYYNKEKVYSENVLPFPYIIFGYHSVIDMLIDPYYRYPTHNIINKENRIYFSGSLLIHDDDIYNHHRNREIIMEKLKQKWNIYFSHQLSHEQYIIELCSSKYCLDLLGVGDPNIRTFEILSSGSLRISQRSNIKWNFDDDFCEETIFDDENDFYTKMVLLETHPEIYEKCIKKQNEILHKYMSKQYLRQYIENSILHR